MCEHIFGKSVDMFIVFESECVFLIAVLMFVLSLSDKVWM